MSRTRVWEEVRRLNAELGVTIFLTTQYLEEADELAHRVGILNAGRLVAEGPPADLKRKVGNDVIVVRVDGDAGVALSSLADVAGVQAVDASGSEVVVTATNGAGTIGPVAVALANSGIPVRDLTLRTPTLDDVFLELTGTHIRPDEGIDEKIEEVTQ
jgi:ABC-2 type transport system ATP-binding protein